METCPLLPASRRGHGGGGAARVPGGARPGGAARCLDPGKDRGSRAGCGAVSRPDLHQPLGQPRGRRLPLRRHVPRGRHGVRRRRRHPPRGGPFSADDDDRQRRRRARLVRGMAADRVDRSRRLLQFGDRGMGQCDAGRAARPRRAAGAGAGSRARCGRVPVHADARGRSRRHPGADFPHQLFGRTQLRDQRAGRFRAGAVAAADRGRRALRHRALRHRGDARAARRKGIHHDRPGDRRVGDAARPRPRRDDREADRIFSAAARCPAATPRDPTASSWSGCCRTIRRKSCPKARSSSPQPAGPRRCR